MSISYIMSTW